VVAAARAGADRVGAAIVATLTAVTLLADPFARLAVPAIDGGGLAPILEHPAMLHHPPLLYAGLALTVVPFLLVLGGDPDPDRLRRAGGVAWLVLGAALLDGAHWAYQELGWGGYWAWDPVENGGLVPWLVLTALVHVALLGRRSRPLVALAALPFPLALLGAAVTRSGAVGSIHAFADGLGIGRALAAAAAVAAAVAVAAVARHPRTPPGGETGPRRRAVATLAVALAAAALVVAAGVVHPFAVGLAGGDAPTVQGWYFARLTAPAAVVVLALVGLGPSLPRRGRVPLGWRHAAALGAAGATVVVTAAGGAAAVPVTASALGAASAVLVVTDRRGRRTPAATGARLAHLGVVVLLVAVAASTAATSRVVALSPGVAVDVGGHDLRLDDVRAVDEGGGASRIHATVDAGRAGTLRPELLVDGRRGIVLAEAALRSTPLEDVQVALRRVTEAGTVVAQVTVAPAIWWVWWGGALVLAGGAVALLSRPRRASAAAAARPSSAPPEAARV